MTAERWADLIQACNQADTAAQQAGRRAVLAAADHYWRMRSKLTRGYQATIIASCPACGTDLTDEAFSYWCGPCQRSWAFCEVAFFDEGLPDD